MNDYPLINLAWSLIPVTGLVILSIFARYFRPRVYAWNIGIGSVGGNSRAKNIVAWVESQAHRIVLLYLLANFFVVVLFGLLVTGGSNNLVRMNNLLESIILGIGWVTFWVAQSFRLRSPLIFGMLSIPDENGVVRSTIVDVRMEPGASQDVALVITNLGFNHLSEWTLSIVFPEAAVEVRRPHEVETDLFKRNYECRVRVPLLNSKRWFRLSEQFSPFYKRNRASVCQAAAGVGSALL